MVEHFIRPVQPSRRAEMPRRFISVIIPTKNEEKLVANTLSLFTPEIKQRFKLEIIVSDGGSTDSTIGIAMAYADGIATHDEERRQTIAEGRNRGAAISHGDILMFLNADSVIPHVQNFLERIAERMAREPSLVALAVKVQIAPAERNWKDRLFHGFFNRYVQLINAFGIGMGRGECQIIRRSAFEGVGGYNPKLPAAEDYDLYRRLRSIGKIAFDSKLLVYESPRRYRKYGYAKVYLEWTKNALAVMAKNKASSEVWEEVR
jgi:glycosyltransferase involved in cell wall biosynthesis